MVIWFAETPVTLINSCLLSSLIANTCGARLTPRSNSFVVIQRLNKDWLNHSGCSKIATSCTHGKHGTGMNGGTEPLGTNNASTVFTDSRKANARLGDVSRTISIPYSDECF